jgi:hypothetical protein
MARKTFCDLCRREIAKEKLIYRIEVSLPPGHGPGGSNQPAHRVEEVCERCAARAVEPPAMPHPDSEVKNLLRKPLTTIAVRHLSGTNLNPDMLAEDLLGCVAANAEAIAKAVR